MYYKRRTEMETTDSSGESLSIKRRTAVKRLQEQCETLMEEIKNYDGDASLTAGGRSAVSNACQALWDCMIVFEDFPFETSSGLAFTYTFKTNRKGEKGNELLISRKEKTITRSTVEAAFHKLLELSRNGGAETAAGNFPVPLKGPKQLGTFGASYLFPVFIQFGLVEYVRKPARTSSL